MRTTNLLLAAAATVALTSATALAGTDVACWNRDLERASFYMSPPEGGDNQFFTALSNQSETTNVSLLYPAKTSMKEFPMRLYRIRQSASPGLGGASPTGCTNQYFNSLIYFMPAYMPNASSALPYQGAYNPSLNYPDPGPAYSGGDGQSDGLSNNRYYRYTEWGAGTPIAGQVQHNTAAAACASATGNVAEQANCETCVATKGYWLNPLVADTYTGPEAGVFSGNFLRFMPPKWTMLSLAYKRLVNGPLLSVLREAVVATNGTAGGQVVQKMLPQSCQGQGRPLNQKLGAINGLSYETNANPISELLFNAAWYMGGQPYTNDTTVWKFPNSATIPGNAMRNGKSGPCNGCSGDFLVLFSDGRSDVANPQCDPANGAGFPKPFCAATANCSAVGLGQENDGNDFAMDPAIVGGAGSGATAATNITGAFRQTPAGTCDMDFADDVAYWMKTQDMGNPGYSPSRISTYVVGIGDEQDTYGEMSSLKAIASRGGGEYVGAEDFENLERAIEATLMKIISRATSFSAAAITSVQTRGYTSAFIPRFRPDDGAKWQGMLSRYQLFNEFANGCSPTDYNSVNTNNPNGNDSCTDFYLRDKNDAFIGEDDNGDFVLLDNSVPWDAGWPLKVGSDGGHIMAEPVWEASQKLFSREADVIAGDTSKARKIYTVAPDDPGYDPTLVAFTVANKSIIAPLLGLGGVNSVYCTTLSGLTRHTYASEADCAEDVIRFMHGEDVLKENPYNRTIPQPYIQQPRIKILGDVFHSTPVLVTPPVPPYLCDLGIANQCVASLYGATLTPGGSTAYNTFTNTHLTRSQFVLVGANDGMLHAFHAGDAIVSGGAVDFDLGTGEELWAFIPPAQLPKLIRYMIGERHEMLVDGTPMVRDIWVDGSGSDTTVDHVKQADEFHTVAIVGEREGGRHYFALDVTNPTLPRFLWEYPKPGTTEALDMAGTWNDLGPNSPPIGAIAEYHSAGPFAVEGIKARERYIVAFGGGFDPSFLRGRSIHFVDAWNGKPVYRFARKDVAAPGNPSDPRNYLFSVAAPVSLLDTNADGLFDAATVGDVAGQLWTISMKNPGHDIGSDGLYDSWYGARAFAQFKADKNHKRAPFFQRAVAAQLNSGEVRVYLGAGDRSQIKDPHGGTCGLGNLSACIRKDCSVDVKSTRYRVGNPPQGNTDGKHVEGHWSVASGGTALTNNAMGADSSGPDGECNDALDAKLEYTVTCGATSQTWSGEAYCDWGATECPVDTGRPLGAKLPYTPAVTMENTRFYAVRLFDLSGPRQQFKTFADSQSYDTSRLTDSDLVNVGAADGGVASLASPGWYLEHAASTSETYDERTASSALLLGGCVVWNTLKPTVAVADACTGSVPYDTAYIYQADAITGSIQCGSQGSSSSMATARWRQRNTYVAPQQPAPVVSINAATSQVLYGGVSLEPGSPPMSVNVGSGDLIGPVHWLEVPRKVHDCRHGDAGCF